MPSPKKALAKETAPHRAGKKGDPSIPERGSALEVEGLSDKGTLGEIRTEAGPSFNASARLKVRGLNVHSDSVAQEKEKVSITLDRSLVEQVRSLFGQRALSTSINDLLYVAFAQERLGELVDEMEREAGPAPGQAYEQVLAQWFEGE